MMFYLMFIGSPERPERPTLAKGDTSVTVKWVNGADGKTPIQGYIVQVREKGGENHCV